MGGRLDLMNEEETRFEVGQLVFHRKLSYRGVVVQADPEFRGTEDWYDSVALSRPPKDRPWYRVLVDGSDDETYVAERHLDVERSGAPIEHPLLGLFFDTFSGSRYVCKRLLN